MKSIIATGLAGLLYTGTALAENPINLISELRGAEKFNGAIIMTEPEAGAKKDPMQNLQIETNAGDKQHYLGFHEISLSPGNLTLPGEKRKTPIISYDPIHDLELDIGPYRCDKERGNTKLLIAPVKEIELERRVEIFQGKKFIMKMGDPGIFDEVPLPCGKYKIISNVLYGGKLFEKKEYKYGRKE